MKKLIKINLIVLIILTVSSSVSAQLCKSSNYRIVANSSHVTFLTLDRNDQVVLGSNCVTGAQSYTWTIGNEVSIQTSTPTVTLSGNDFLWLPAGGCKDFNKNWKSYNPLFNKENPCWTGQYPLGDYATSITVRANNSTSSYTIPVKISNTEFCRDSETKCKGNDLGSEPNLEDGDIKEGPDLGGN